MSQELKLLIFGIDNAFCALRQNDIVVILNSARLSAMPEMPESMEGTLNLHGEIIPVIAIRRLLNMPERTLAATDYLVVFNTPKGNAVLRSEILPFIADCEISENAVLSGLDLVGDLVEGAGRTGSGTVSLLNPDALYNPEMAGFIQELKLADPAPEETGS